MEQKYVNWLLAGAAAGITWGLVRRKPLYDYEGRTVIVTGGSRGLGLVLSRKLVDRGARVAICAREAGELHRAEEELKERAGTVAASRCDVRDKSEVNQFVRDVAGKFGSIDVLINNAGVIQVGPLEVQTEQDFRDAMDTHFWGPFHMVNAVLPVMRRQNEGRIANIASIGGKLAVPHLAPYCASKFALAGLSSAYSSELAKDGISVTCVFPGLMRTGSHINAIFKGQNKKEFAMFSILDGLPLTSVSAESAAEQILHAIAEGRSELTISVQAKAAALARAVAPELVSSALKNTNAWLPEEGGIGKKHATGLESTSAASPSVLTSLIDSAARRNNELKPGESLG